MRVVIIGGTGTVGSEVTRQLTGRGAEVAVVSRSGRRAADTPDGVTTLVGDLAAPSSLAAALDGADAAFIATPLDPNESQLGLNAVEAAKQAKVGHVVYMSVHRLRDCMEIPHFASKVPIEDAFAASGVPYTFIQPNNFFQNDYWVKDAITKYGVYPQPLGQVGSNRVDVRDIALGAVNAIMEPGHAGKAYAAVGPDVLSGPGTAAIYGRVLGREVHYVGDDLDAWEAAARQMMPGWMVDDLRIMYASFLDKGLLATEDEVSGFTGLLGQAPRRFEDFVKELAGA